MNTKHSKLHRQYPIGKILLVIVIGLLLFLELHAIDRELRTVRKESNVERPSNRHRL